MKKAIFKSLLLLALVSLLSVGAAAADKPAFLFALWADGETELSVSTGDVITVTLELHRTDRQQDYTMYAMQDEIRYDKTFFRLVTDSDQPASGVQTRDIALRDHHRAHYLNFVSLSGGRSWSANAFIGSFQLEVIGTTGVACLENSGLQVSLPDGSGSYPVSRQNVTVILSDQCEVRFETNGGSAVAAKTVKRGTLLSKPADPVKSGYQFEGWYKDVDGKEPWDFTRDRVDVNTHLYAKWKKNESGQRYEDVLPGDWFFADVDYVSSHGLMDGVGGGKFAPYASTNRAMVVTILWRLEGKPAGGGGIFRDVPADMWYTEAIGWAAANGIVTGYSADTFGPLDNVTREQMAVILYRYAGFKGYHVSQRADLSRYVDSAKVSAWAKDGLSWAKATGLISGMPDQTLAPQNTALRCQTAAILHRFHQTIQ